MSSEKETGEDRGSGAFEFEGDLELNTVLAGSAGK